MSGLLPAVFLVGTLGSATTPYTIQVYGAWEDPQVDVLVASADEVLPGAVGLAAAYAWLPGPYAQPPQRTGVDPSSYAERAYC